MTEDITPRDEVWLQVLTLARVKGQFKLDEIDVDAHNRTILNVLHVMEEMGIVARKTKRSGHWFAGPTMVKYMNMTENAQERAITDVKKAVNGPDKEYIENLSKNTIDI